MAQRRRCRKASGGLAQDGLHHLVERTGGLEVVGQRIDDGRTAGHGQGQGRHDQAAMPATAGPSLEDTLALSMSKGLRDRMFWNLSVVSTKTKTKSEQPRDMFQGGVVSIADLEAVRKAFEIELGGHAFYQRASRDSKDPVLQDLFARFAEM